MRLAGGENGGVGKRSGVALGVAVGLIACLVLSGAAAGLVRSTASNKVVQPQPAAGSCHATGSGVYARPDPRCTPGALNPKVTQATIYQTICRDGWTRTVRPPEAITEAEKRLSMAAYGDTRPIWTYEYDHLVPLELGGATNDPRNLWPEPGASPNPKDKLEDALNRAVCDGRLSLAKAQAEVATNWVKPARRGVGSAPPSPPASPSAWCSASASWNSQYGEYDVYVHSNQPNQWASVTGAGQTGGYDTDGSGYADVYFYASSDDAGSQVTVRVGAATCYATL